MARTRTTKHPDGVTHTLIVPREQWQFLLQGVHAGYITWEDYEANLRQLQQNRPARREKTAVMVLRGKGQPCSRDSSFVDGVAIG